ncbi:head GIN domain-containing protein [uncultured Sphingomonas sp.]|uniref:head GIN domain-containing protein n=1 Tax=uncultured Sphingomonas sp. TaxID=158754 RepID=UPI0025D5C1CC|nr:head GIN domain-containing protein [uncultured Sphingomonas sp.]
MPVVNFRVIALSVFSLAASGCVVAVERPRERVADDLSPVERRFAPKSLTSVELAGSDRVQVTRGPAVSVTASGDPRAVAALDIAVRGDTLRIDRLPGSYRDRGALVSVTVPSLRMASISGSGAMSIVAVESPDFTGSVARSGAMRVADLRARTVRFDLSGSGAISASGSTDDAALDLGGSGSIDVRGLAVSALTISAGGSGTVSATATRTATIRAGGSGSVRVTGGARCDVAKGGSGSVRCG